MQWWSIPKREKKVRNILNLKTNWQNQLKPRLYNVTLSSIWLQNTVSNGTVPLRLLWFIDLFLEFVDNLPCAMCDFGLSFGRIQSRFSVFYFSFQSILLLLLCYCVFCLVNSFENIFTVQRTKRKPYGYSCWFSPLSKRSSSSTYDFLNIDFFQHKKQQPLRIGAVTIGVFCVFSTNEFLLRNAMCTMTVHCTMYMSVCVWVCVHLRYGNIVSSACVFVFVFSCLRYTIGKMKGSSGVLNG